MTWQITPLTAADADGLGRLHVAVWREAYAALMPADYLAGLEPSAGAARWRDWAADPGAPATWVARDEAGLVGFATAGASRDAVPVRERELWAINLLARAHGTGLADELLRLALGDAPASLWVVEANHRAIAFYRRHGFAPDGLRGTHPPTGTPEIRMVRPAGG